MKHASAGWEYGRVALLRRESINCFGGDLFGVNQALGPYRRVSDIDGILCVDELVHWFP